MRAQSSPPSIRPAAGRHRRLTRGTVHLFLRPEDPGTLTWRVNWGSGMRASRIEDPETSPVLINFCRLVPQPPSPRMGCIAVARNRVRCVTEHFDPDGVGPPARLRIGAYDVVYFRQSVPDPILALFRDSQWTRVQTDVNLLDEPIYTYPLESPPEQILPP